MRDILKAKKEKMIRELSRDKPTEERISELKASVSFVVYFVLMATILVGGYAYVESQPIIFEGDIVISGTIDGNQIISVINSTHLNESIGNGIESMNISSIDGEIQLHGKYQVPTHFFTKLVTGLTTSPKKVNPLWGV